MELTEALRNRRLERQKARQDVVNAEDHFPERTALFIYRAKGIRFGAGSIENDIQKNNKQRLTFVPMQGC